MKSLALRVSRPCLAMGKQTDRSVARKQPVEIFRQTDNRTDRSLAKKQDQELPFKKNSSSNTNITWLAVKVAIDLV